MRKVVFGSSVSLDGFVGCAFGEPLSHWLHSPDWYLRSFLPAFDTIFYGRRSYENYCLSQSSLVYGNRDIGFFEQVNAMRKYVFSRSFKHVQGNAMVIFENMEAQVTRIRNENGKNIWLAGGLELTDAFIAQGLIDEYILFVHPVELEYGRPVFSVGPNIPELQLIDRNAVGSGVIMYRYVQTGITSINKQTAKVLW